MVEAKYTLDGQENTNPAATGGPGGGATVVSKSKWDGEKLVIEGTRNMNLQGQQMSIGIKEVYSLSPDSKMLTIETTTNSPRGTNTTKQVFNKQ